MDDGEKGIAAYAASLGKAYGQEAVGEFAEDPNGKDRAYTFHGLTDLAGAAKRAADKLGFANVTGDTMTFWGTPADGQKVADLAGELGATVELTSGSANFIKAKDYERTIRAGQGAG